MLSKQLTDNLGLWILIIVRTACYMIRKLCAKCPKILLKIVCEISCGCQEFDELLYELIYVMNKVIIKKILNFFLKMKLSIDLSCRKITLMQKEMS